MFSSRSTGLDALINRPRPSLLQRFTQAPLFFTAHLLYKHQPTLPQRLIDNAVSVTCISDTHNSQPKLPTGEILIHAGDLTQSGSFDEIQQALGWINTQPHRHKVVVAGNHDALLDAEYDDKNATANEAWRKQLNWGSIVYLENEETTVTCENGRSLRIYGSPMSPRHGNWAFQYPRSHAIWNSKIPIGIDILITHGPPRSHLDLMRFGCVHLLKRLWEVQPRLHVFGHAHEGYGQERVYFDNIQRAYEQVVIGRDRWCNLVLLFWAFLVVWAVGRTEPPRCQLVNAAMVGGIRDDQRRRATQVVM